MNHGKLQVLVVTPLGEGGKGGIDRIMDGLREAIQKDLDDSSVVVRFSVSRGQKPIFFSVFFLLGVLLKIIFLKLFSKLDLVHLNLSSHGSCSRKTIIARLCEWLNVDYVIHLHGSRFRTYVAEINGSHMGVAVNRMMCNAAKVIVLGQVWKEYVIAAFGIAESKISLLKNASESVSVSSKTDGSSTNIIFLGRLGSRKGVPDLIAAAKAMAHLPNWSLTIAGDGEVAEMKALALRLGVDERIAFTGWVDPATVNQLIHTADVLVLPSYDENLPMSVIEGMAAGLAVICTPVGAVPDIIFDGINGLLVEPGDVANLSAAMQKLVSDQPFRRELGVSARAFHAEHLEINVFKHNLFGIWAAVGRSLG